MLDYGSIIVVSVMSRGERYPSEGFDGSPFYMGKKRKATRADGTQKDAIHPLAEVNRCNSIDEVNFSAMKPAIVL